MSDAIFDSDEAGRLRKELIDSIRDPYFGYMLEGNFETRALLEVLHEKGLVDKKEVERRFEQILEEEIEILKRAAAMGREWRASGLIDELDHDTIVEKIRDCDYE